MRMGDGGWVVLLSLHTFLFLVMLCVIHLVAGTESYWVSASDVC